MQDIMRESGVDGHAKSAVCVLSDALATKLGTVRRVE